MNDPKQYTHEELVNATNDFDRAIGIGDSGIVYHGTIDNRDVAVKRFHELRDPRDKHFSEFYSEELCVLTRTDHDCIVKLLGFCPERNLLVYELVHGETLADLLTGHLRFGKFTTLRRTRILLDVAQAMHYLHNHPMQIVHRDLNITNVLVEGMTFSAKITGFSKPRYMGAVVGGPSAVEIDIPRYPKYQDPLYASTKRVDITNDIYSIGLVILYTLFGRVYDSHKVLKGKGNDVNVFMDTRLKGRYPPSEMEHILSIARRCVFDRHMRPNINKVLIVLRRVCENIEKWEKQRKESSTSRPAQGGL